MKKSRSGRLRRVATWLSFVAVVLAAVLLGWSLHDWTVDEQGDVSIDRPLKVTYGDAPAAGAMPNVLGLDEQAARQVLADAGVDLADVDSGRSPYVGETGVVVGQSPSSTRSFTGGRVVLELSEPAVMPGLAGKPEADAREALERVGAAVLTSSSYRSGVSEGTVLSTEPIAGTPLGRDATLVLAEAPSSVFLSQLESVSSDCAPETLNLAGTKREEALTCDLNAGDPASMVYLLNRDVDVFRATVGLADRGGSDGEVDFRVIVDGRERAAVSVPFGATERLVVPVDGALRARLEARSNSAASTGDPVRAVWADPAFQGGRIAIDALAAESGY